VGSGRFFVSPALTGPPGMNRTTRVFRTEMRDPLASPGSL
jgi:hypothetical protein